MRKLRTAGVLTSAAVLALATPCFAHHRYEVTGALGGALGSRLGVGTAPSRGEVGSAVSPVIVIQAGMRTELDGFASLSFSHQDFTLGYRSVGATSDTASLAMTRQDLALGGYLEHTYGLWVPYLGAQLGATRFAAGGFDDEYRPLIVLDGGLKVDVSELVQLRLLLRAPMTLMTANSQILCVAPLGCDQSFNGTPYFQLQAALGVTFTF